MRVMVRLHHSTVLLLFILLSATILVAETQRISENESRVPPPNHRIVGGSAAGPLLTRHMAYLVINYRDASYSGLCTATVVAPRWLLTAGHCFAGPNGALSAVPASTYAFVGESNALLRVHNTAKRPYWARVVHVHAKFKPGSHDHRNDIALVELDRSIPKESFSSVQLASDASNMPPSGTAVSAAGYGTLSELGGKAPHLMKTTLVVKPFNVCAETEHSYFRRFMRDWAQVCAVSVGWPDSGKTDTCYGDSGGPLFYLKKKEARLVQFGITSFGNSPCAMRGSVAWYTRVSAYYSQIQQRVYGNNGASWKSFS